ncbi:MAG TPA: DUF5985 family protein [Xanthomonadaceae bacterium]|jgi:hypothetical protein
MNDFLLGAISMGSAVAALLFLRFWRQTRDRLFLCFAASFLLEAIDRAILTFSAHGEEGIVYYLIRLASYLLILGAIIDKNVRRVR